MPIADILSSAQAHDHSTYLGMAYWNDFDRIRSYSEELTPNLVAVVSELKAAQTNDKSVKAAVGALEGGILLRRGAWLRNLAQYAALVQTLSHGAEDLSTKLKDLEYRRAVVQQQAADARRAYQDAAALDNVPIAGRVERAVRSNVDSYYQAWQELEAEIQAIDRTRRELTSEWYTRLRFFAGGDLADPTPDVSGLGKRRVNSTGPGAAGQLWSSDANGQPSISQDDVRQGALGDCYFCAATAAFIATPQGKARITEMIRDNGDGTFTVTFPGHAPVVIDGDLYTVRGGYAYAQAGPDLDYWFLILEKAYAVVFTGNSFSEMEGGDPGKVLELLGMKVETFLPKDEPGHSLSVALAAGAGAVGAVAAFDMRRIASKYAHKPKREGHALTITGVQTGPPQRITMRNPWGENSDLTPPAGYEGKITYSTVDGTIQMDLDVFEELCDGVSVGTFE